MQGLLNWLPTPPHLVSTLSCWVWALCKFKVVQKKACCPRSLVLKVRFQWWNQTIATLKQHCKNEKGIFLPQISQQFPLKQNHWAHLCIRNPTPLNSCSKPPIAGSRDKDFPHEALLAGMWESSSHAIEMGSWKEDEENDLHSSWFLPKHVCSVGVLEFFPEGRSQNLQCQSWRRVPFT